MTGKSNFIVDESTKTLTIEISDKYDKDGALEYTSKYKSETSKLATSNYTLILDCRQLKIGTQDSVPILEKCFEYYRDHNFKSVTALLIKPQKFLGCEFEEINKKIGATNFSVEYK